MTPSEETNGSALPSAHDAATRIRVHRVGEVTKHGPCWRLTYTYCEHTQDFALDGLEDPEHLVRFVLRYFTDCLTCDAMARQAGAVDEQAAHLGAMFPRLPPMAPADPCVPPAVRTDGASAPRAHWYNAE